MFQYLFPSLWTLLLQTKHVLPETKCHSCIKSDWINTGPTMMWWFNSIITHTWEGYGNHHVRYHIFSEADVVTPVHRLPVTYSLSNRYGRKQ